MGPLIEPKDPITDGVVSLRPFESSDVGVVTEACQDPEISRWTASIPWPYEEAHARSWIGLQRGFWRSGTNASFAAVSAEGGEFYGAVSLDRIDGAMGSAAVGYWTAAWARNRGLTTRAVRLITDWAFDTLGLRVIELMTKLENVASERVAQKAGFVFDGVIADYLPGRAIDAGASYQVTRWVRRGTSPED